MGAGAVAMLLVAVVVVFGGLTAATIFLIRKPQVDSYPPMPAALVGDQD